MSQSRASNFEVALTKCYFCGDSADIIINTLLVESAARRVKECHGKVAHMHPCNKCQEMMKMGVILLTIDSEKSEPGWNAPPRYASEAEKRHFMPNPYRTGGFFVVRDEFVEKVFHPKEMADWAIKHRWMFIEHQAAEMMGLFKGKGTHDPETMQELPRENG
jgi:hypothetical protein